MRAEASRRLEERIGRARGPLAAPARLGVPGGRFLALAAAAPVLLALARLLPAEGPGLALRLAAAAACVLLVPGVLVLRAIGWTAGPGTATAAAFALSLLVVLAALAATFAANGSLTVTIGAIALVALVALVPAARARPVASARSERLALLGVVAAAIALAAAVWWAAGTLGTGDVLFHLARARKLAEADVLASAGVANEFRDGGLHPGYAFPLWHGVLALVARLAAVDTATVVLHLAAVLVPLAFVVAYGAGVALFRSWAGGVATVAAQAAQLGFSHAGTGSFASLALPSSVSRIVLAPAVVALAIAFLRDRDWRILGALAAAALALAVVHPTYAIFVAILLAGFAAAWLLLGGIRGRVARLAAFLGAVVVPPAVFFVWLLPVATSPASIQPSAAERARPLAHYGGQVEIAGDAFRAAPEAITRTGPAIVAGLLVVPLAVLAARRLWAALVLGGSLTILALLLVPTLFANLSDLVSLSQSRRLAQFLPIPFALAGAAILLGRLRLAGAAVALAGGIAIQLAYPGEFTHQVRQGGPEWPLWVAVGGGALALAAGILLRGRPLRGPEPTRWAVAAALAFALPLAVGGFADFERADARDADALTPGLVAELRRLDSRDVVFAPVATSYRVAAFAAVYVAASPPSHVGDTEANRPYLRRRDVTTFFSADGAVTNARRRAILAQYGADWLLIDKARPYPRSLVRSLRSVYEDGSYALYRVGAG